jgi:WD40 repeat protein
VCQLKGHRNDVILLQWSHCGQQLATGSKDGSVRVSVSGWPPRLCSRIDGLRRDEGYPPELLGGLPAHSRPYAAAHRTHTQLQ